MSFSLYQNKKRKLGSYSPSNWTVTPKKKLRISPFAKGRSILSMSSSSSDAEKYSTVVASAGDSTVTTQFKKRYAPKKYRARAKRRYKSFVRNSMKLVGQNTLVLNGVAGNTYPVDGGQGQNTYFLTLGGKSYHSNSATQIGADDLRKLVQGDNRINSPSHKLLIKNSRLEITLKNAGTTNQEIDMFVIKHSKEGSHLESCNVEIQNAQTATPIVPGSGATDPTLLLRGMTLFDFPLWTRRGNTIVEKKKFIVPAGQTITYFMKNKPNFWFSAGDITGTSGANPDSYVKSGYTKTVAFTCKPVVGETGTNTISIGYTSRFTYKIFQDNRTYNVYNST